MPSIATSISRRSPRPLWAASAAWAKEERSAGKGLLDIAVGGAGNLHGNIGRHDAALDGDEQTLIDLGHICTEIWKDTAPAQLVDIVVSATETTPPPP
jgi:hypothetical protein